MSSLAATQADGYYIPAACYDSGQYPKKSKNQLAGSKGHNQYLQRGVVRFELPYKGVCQKCQKSIGRGTRYNAEKTHNNDEFYFSTKIWTFSMKCRNCQHPWIIKTNPQERGFDYVSGVTIQKGQELDGMEHDLTTSSSTAAAGLATAPIVASKSPLERLESAAHGKQKTLTELERLQQQQQRNQETTLLDAQMNASIRSGFRKERKEKRSRLLQAKNLGWREGMQVLAPTMEDSLQAKETVYGAQPKATESKQWANLCQSSIFSTKTTKKPTRKRQTPTFSSSQSSSVTHASPIPVVSTSIVAEVVRSSFDPVKNINPGALVPNESSPMESSNNNSFSTNKKKKKKITTTLTVYNASKTSASLDPSNNNITKPAENQEYPSSSSSSCPNRKSSFTDMLAGYGSDDS